MGDFSDVASFSQGVTTSEFCMFRITKTRIMGLPYDMLSHFDTIPECDRRTEFWYQLSHISHVDMQ